MLMEEQATVGLRIKKLREQLELKQADFAQQLSEDPKKISRIEKEVQFPDSNFLIQLGERLDVSLDWILRGIGKMFLSDSASTSANLFPAEVDSGDFAFVPIQLMIAAQPTRGIDVGSIEFIHQQIVAKRDEGIAVLLISSELDEIMALSDRIVVMYRGSIIGEVLNKETTRQELGLLMAGVKSDSENIHLSAP